MIATFLLLALLSVSTRENSTSVDNWTAVELELSSGGAAPENPDAEYDPETDTLYRNERGERHAYTDYLSRQYDCSLRLRNPNCDARTPPVGWMTWYAVGFDASEKTILKNAKDFMAAFRGYTDEKPVLWVDWEWYHRCFRSYGKDGEDVFHPHAQSYPRGLKALADDLDALGFTPALWIAPQVDVRTNKWLFAAPERRVLADDLFWGGHVWADPTAPGFEEEYLKPLLREYRGWGFRMFKWDCLPATAWTLDKYRNRLYDKSRSTREIFRDMLKAGREAIGNDAYLISCCGNGDSPFLWATDICDGGRVGGDIFSWTSFKGQGIDMLLRYIPLKALGYRLDADNLVLRGEYSNAAQARTRVSIYALAGVPITIGDPISALDGERISMLRMAMPVVEMAPCSLRPSFRADLEALRITAHFKRVWGEWDVVSFSNLDTNGEYVVEYRFPQGRCVWDVWNHKLFCYGDGGKRKITVPPGDTRVFRVSQLDDLRPTLVGTTRHLTQGGYEIDDLRTTKDGVEWTWHGLDGPNDRLFFHWRGQIFEARAGDGKWSEHGRAKPSEGN